MDTIDPVWLFGGIALLCGVLIGAFLYRRFNPVSGDVDKLKAELERSRAELDEYKTSVNRHFSKTSDLVSELTQDYVRVYQHLAEGAETLGNNPEFARALEQSQGRVLISVEDDAEDPEAAASLIETGVPEAPPAVATEDDGDARGRAPGAGDAGEAPDAARAEQTGDAAEGDREPAAEAAPGEPDASVEETPAADPAAQPDAGSSADSPADTAGENTTRKA